MRRRRRAARPPSSSSPPCRSEQGVGARLACILKACSMMLANKRLALVVFCQQQWAVHTLSAPPYTSVRKHDNIHIYVRYTYIYIYLYIYICIYIYLSECLSLGLVCVLLLRPTARAFGSGVARRCLCNVDFVHVAAKALCLTWGLNHYESSWE